MGKAPKIEFGKLYRDHITGFQGKCTGICHYISGCTQVLVVPSVDKEGKIVEGDRAMGFTTERDALEWIKQQSAMER